MLATYSIKNKKRAKKSPLDLNLLDMKQFTLITLATLFTLALNAQKTIIEPGTLQFNAAIGVVSTYFKDDVQTSVPPVSVSAEVFVSPNISIGLYGAYTQAKGERAYENADVLESYDNKTKQFALKSSFYTNEMNNWRVYGGVLTGVSMADVDKDSSTIKGDTSDNEPSFSRPESPNTFMFSGFVGVQRRVKKHVFAYGELGYGISLVNLGLSYRF